MSEQYSPEMIEKVNQLLEANKRSSSMNGETLSSDEKENLAKMLEGSEPVRDQKPQQDEGWSDEPVDVPPISKLVERKKDESTIYMQPDSEDISVVSWLKEVISDEISQIEGEVSVEGVFKNLLKRVFGTDNLNDELAEKVRKFVRQSVKKEGVVRKGDVITLETDEGVITGAVSRISESTLTVETEKGNVDVSLLVPGRVRKTTGLDELLDNSDCDDVDDLIDRMIED